MRLSRSAQLSVKVAVRAISLCLAVACMPRRKIGDHGMLTRTHSKKRTYSTWADRHAKETVFFFFFLYCLMTDIYLSFFLS